MFRSWIKLAIIVAGGLIGVLLVAFVILYIIGTVKVNQTYNIPVTVPPIPNDAAAIARGKHIATSFGLCANCHADNFVGKNDFSIPGMLTIPTPNLTKGAGGVGRHYTDEDWVRAIRHGVGSDKRALFIMTSQAYHQLSAEDLGAVIAYMKQLPPVDSALPARRIEIIGRLMMGAGMVPPFAVDQIDHNVPPPAAPPSGVTIAYGKYLTRTCTECHGAQLNGMPFGPPGEEVPSPNLTRGGELSTWSEADFFNLMRTGMTPSKKVVMTEMPWLYYRRMTDDELKAVWMYLQSLPALPQGK